MGILAFHLIDVVQFGTWSPTVVGFFPEPLGANFNPTAARLTAAGPVGPLAQLAVRGTRDDARLLDVAWDQTVTEIFIENCSGSVVTLTQTAH